MCDAPLEDDRAVAKRQSELVQGVELEGKAGFDLRSAAADLFDRHRLKHHDLAVELAEDGNPFGVALLAGHRRRL